MAEREWYWNEVAFIPNGVAPEDTLRFQGHIFIKSSVVEELKSKGGFKRKQGKKKKKRRERVKKYCSKCGRPLIDNHCPVHILDMVPVDKNAKVVRKFKKLKGIGS